MGINNYPDGKTCFKCTWRSNDTIVPDINGERVFCEHFSNVVTVKEALKCDKYPGKDRGNKYDDRESPHEILKRKREKYLSYIAIILSFTSIIISGFSLYISYRKAVFESNIYTQGTRQGGTTDSKQSGGRSSTGKNVK